MHDNEDEHGGAWISILNSELKTETYSSLSFLVPNNWNGSLLLSKVYVDWYRATQTVKEWPHVPIGSSYIFNYGIGIYVLCVLFSKYLFFTDKCDVHFKFKAKKEYKGQRLASTDKVKKLITWQEETLHVTLRRQKW